MIAGAQMSAVSFKRGDLTVADDEPDDRSLTFWQQLFERAKVQLQLPSCGMTDCMMLRLLQRVHMLPTIILCSMPDSPVGTHCHACLNCLYYSVLVQSLQHRVNVEHVWHHAVEQFPEALAPLSEPPLPHHPAQRSRWHLFWLHLVTDRVPPHAPTLSTLVQRWRSVCRARWQQWHPQNAEIGAPHDASHITHVMQRLHHINR